MSSFSITGRIHSGGFPEQKGDNFTVRQFTLEVTENTNSGTVYSNFIGFQLSNDKCALLDNFAIGQAVTVHFNLRGSLWQGKTITNLQAWKMEAVQAQQQAPQYQQQQPQPLQQPAQQQWQQPAQYPQQQPAQYQQQPAPPAFGQPAPAQPQQPQQWSQQPAPQPAFGSPQQQPQQFGQPQQQQFFQPQQNGTGNDLPF